MYMRSLRIGDQEKPWVPHEVCCICVEWIQGKKQPFRFGIPMVWREQKNHNDDCYFCTCNVKGFNLKNKKQISYPNIPSAPRPVPHGPGIPVPSPPVTVENVFYSDTESEIDDEVDEVHDSISNEPKLCTQSELNDFVKKQN
ncbi:hypothetical protein AVEN_75784-1 [Araneus ventricosus]|uniref:Uncharacterized protein n=1 Tax=Araneus ventricosus TaxID=182803 RepID=A0A4Y2FZB1_ARAVE|nr:hypothetical protein AVEN_71029-1 [Araneus ventricosus]GBM46883.1 hypothetical protein AVEN_75784-1 [Araneus ventricosus]